MKKLFTLIAMCLLGVGAMQADEWSYDFYTQAVNNLTSGSSNAVTPTLSDAVFSVKVNGGNTASFCNVTAWGSTSIAVPSTNFAIVNNGGPTLQHVYQVEKTSGDVTTPAECRTGLYFSGQKRIAIQNLVVGQKITITANKTGVITLDNNSNIITATNTPTAVTEQRTCAGKTRDVNVVTYTYDVSTSGSQAFLIAASTIYSIAVENVASDLAIVDGKSSITLDPQGTYTLAQTTDYTTSSTGTITYESDATDVATVDTDGKITAVAGGTANITLKQAAADPYKESSISFTVTVRKPYTVTFNAGVDGTCETASLTEESIGAGVTLPSVTANSGYSFSGWATTEGATTADAGAVGDNYKPSADCTLYAVYTSPATWEIDFAKWATDYVTQSKNPSITNAAVKNYTVNKVSTQFYNFIPPTSDVKEDAPTTVFDTKFLADKNSSFLERFRSSTELGLFVNASDGTTTTYVVRELKVGDILYIAAESAPTFIETEYVEKIPYSCGDKISFSYTDSKGTSTKTLPYIVRQYKVTKAGDQLFTIPNRKYIYKVGVASSLKDNSTKEQFAAGGNGYSTFSAQSNFKVTGAEVYYAPTTPSGESVTLTKVADDAIIPANQGVILKAAAAGDNITVNLTTAAATTDLSDNNLKAVKSGDTEWATGTNYVLMSKNSETKFFDADNSSNILTQLVGKCYLNVPTPGAKSSYGIVWGGEIVTAISNVNANVDANKAPATRKAMVNGKFIIVKDGKQYNAAGARIK